MSICSDCGDELDDFAPCPCVFVPRQKTVPSEDKRPYYAQSMRQMVARKLDRERLAAKR